MKIAVISKPANNGGDIKNNLLRYLKDTGKFDVLEYSKAKEISGNIDRILVFGGDGTMLKASKKGAELNIPVLGVNLGNVGFLAEAEITVSGEELVNMLEFGAITQKFLLKANCLNSSYSALNDIVIKSNSTRPIYLDLYVDGNFVDCYHSDGLILSTPTGSTAYSLSAGGPIIAPDVDAIIINPVCPHSLHSRPLIIGVNSVVQVYARGDENANLIVDGDLAQELEKNQSVEICKSANDCKFITVNNEQSFYKKLLEKMNRWGTTCH